MVVMRQQTWGLFFSSFGFFTLYFCVDCFYLIYLLVEYLSEVKTLMSFMMTFFLIRVYGSIGYS